MLTEKQVEEIREHLEKAQNPIFFFDNDPDGFCSFLILQKFIGRGKGVSIRTFPEMGNSLIRKISEFNSDYIFILDKPVISKDFFSEIEKLNLPVVMIDHHNIEIEKLPEWIYFYNPLFNKSKFNEPTTALCYQVTRRKEDLWLNIIGCITDKFVPENYSEFQKIYPELSIKSTDAFEILYKSEIGKICRMISFGLKDKTTNVVNMMKSFLDAKSPHNILEENSQNKSFHQKFEFLDKKYKKFIERGIEVGKKSGKILFFEYGGDTSMSGEISNELSFLFKNKVVVVIYSSGSKANISVRGKNIREGLLRAISNLEGATGGGHVEKFKYNFRNELGN
jgi:oligoribonuclease NrnB/cAMP/cGMP phosphodiesterase (DHH superfamily)